MGWYRCHVFQDVCPWNVRFAKELPNDSPYAPREALGTEDARTLARDSLGMSQPEFSATFKGSPMKRAKRRGLARSAAVALGTVGTLGTPRRSKPSCSTMSHAPASPRRGRSTAPRPQSRFGGWPLRRGACTFAPEIGPCGLAARPHDPRCEETVCETPALPGAVVARVVRRDERH
jgi:epoxyqueuosine reductase